MQKQEEESRMDKWTASNVVATASIDYVATTQSTVGYLSLSASDVRVLIDVMSRADLTGIEYHLLDRLEDWFKQTK